MVYNRETCQGLFGDQAARVREVGEVAESLGATCYIVGGASRDCVLGRQPHDFDFVCDDARGVAGELRRRGASGSWHHGGTTWMGSYGGMELDIKHNPGLSAPGGLEADARARAVTANALYLGVGSRNWLELRDPTGRAEADIAARVVRPIGDPDAAIAAEPWLLIKIPRLAAKRDMEISPDLLAAMRAHAGEVGVVKYNKMRREIGKARCGGPAVFARFKGILSDLGVDRHPRVAEYIRWNDERLAEPAACELNDEEP